MLKTRKTYTQKKRSKDLAGQYSYGNAVPLPENENSLVMKGFCNLDGRKTHYCIIKNGEEIPVYTYEGLQRRFFINADNSFLTIEQCAEVTQKDKKFFYRGEQVTEKYQRNALNTLSNHIPLSALLIARVNRLNYVRWKQKTILISPTIPQPVFTEKNNISSLLLAEQEGVISGGLNASVESHYQSSSIPQNPVNSPSSPNTHSPYNFPSPINITTLISHIHQNNNPSTFSSPASFAPAHRQKGPETQIKRTKRPFIAPTPSAKRDSLEPSLYALSFFENTQELPEANPVIPLDKEQVSESVGSLFSSEFYA